MSKTCKTADIAALLDKPAVARSGNKCGLLALLLSCLLPSVAASAGDLSAASIRVTWTPTPVANAQAVYPHPLIPGRALLATDKGLSLTEDAGRTWTALDGAAAARIGKPAGVALWLERPETFYVATDKGLWLAEDLGKTVERIADSRGGLKSDRLAGVACYQGDPSLRTLLVWYGEAAPGASVSYDSGRSWQTVWPDMFVHRFVGSPNQGTSFVLLAAQKSRPQVINALACPCLGESPEDSVGDILPVDAAVSLAGHGLRIGRGYHCDTEVIIGTSDGDLHDLKFGPDSTAKIGPQGVSSWASVGTCWSPFPDTQLFYAYDPEKLGLVLSLDGFQTFAQRSAGLPVGPLIKEGSQVRANMSGGQFYAVVNNRLYLGVTGGDGLVVSQPVVAPNIVRISPAAARAQEMMLGLSREPSAAQAARRIMAEIEKAGQSPMTITAKMAAPGGKKPASVTVNLWPVGGPQAADMREDSARPGVYTAGFRYLDGFQPNPNKKRPREGSFHGPGVVALVVTATAADGRSAGAAVPLVVCDRIETFSIWDEFRYAPRDQGRYATQGAAQATLVDGAESAHTGRYALRVATKGGQWSLRLSAEIGCNLASYDAVSFWIRTEGNLGDRLFVQLEDSPVLLEPAATPRVAVTADAFSLHSAGYRQVVIPATQFMKDAGAFRPTLCRTFVLSGAGPAPATFWIDTVELLKSEE